MTFISNKALNLLDIWVIIVPNIFVILATNGGLFYWFQNIRIWRWYLSGHWAVSRRCCTVKCGGLFADLFDSSLCILGFALFNNILESAAPRTLCKLSVCWNVFLCLLTCIAWVYSFFFILWPLTATYVW